jgi:hypothetical protein
LIRHAKSTDAARGCPALLNGEEAAIGGTAQHPLNIVRTIEYYHRALAGVCDSTAVISTSAAITLVSKRIGRPPLVVFQITPWARTLIRTSRPSELSGLLTTHEDAAARGLIERQPLPTALRVPGQIIFT